MVKQMHHRLLVGGPDPQRLVRILRPDGHQVFVHVRHATAATKDRGLAQRLLAAGAGEAGRGGPLPPPDREGVSGRAHTPRSRVRRAGDRTEDWYVGQRQSSSSG